jgi:hypothetical protein
MAAALVCQENPNLKMPGINPDRRLQTVYYGLKKSSVKKSMAEILDISIVQYITISQLTRFLRVAAAGDFIAMFQINNSPVVVGIGVLWDKRENTETYHS